MSIRTPLVIRADATQSMGTGHIMRCIALAQEWIRRGGEVHFFSHCSNRALEKKILDCGAQCHQIERFDPEGGAAAVFIERLKKWNSPFIIVDGYHFKPGYHARLQKSGYKVMILDDYHHLDFYHADMILNQNLAAKNIEYQVSDKTILLLGEIYILLRDEFLKFDCSPKKTRQKNNVQILISMGGSDPDNTSSKVIKALMQLKKPNITVKIIIGPDCPHNVNIQKRLAQCNFPGEVIINTPDMPSHMAWADLAISAAGSTAWELLYMGVPSIFMVNAENQKNVAEAVQKANAGINAGWYKTITHDDLASHVNLILKDEGTAEKFSKNGKKLIDGNGRKRVVDHILNDFI